MQTVSVPSRSAWEIGIMSYFICNIPDAAYMDNNAYKVMQLTAWIPVMNADKETGCLQVRLQRGF